MSSESNVSPDEKKESQAVVIVDTPPTPPQDLSLNLDLYNYDTPDAQSCPYVLTSPRSLEACSRIGIKPVDLLHKTLAEFSEEIESEKPLEEIVKLYDEHEQQRITLLQRCQAEREFLIWRSTSKRRSQSLSPCRRNQLHHKEKKSESSGIQLQKADRKSSDDLLLCASNEERQRGEFQRSSSAKNLSRSHCHPTSWSTPSSPHYHGSRNLFVRITSPVVCAKLQTFPKSKMRLPPKDMKILEVILQKYEKAEEDAQMRAKAQRSWDREREVRDRRREAAELERWKNLALRQKRSSSEERLKFDSEKDTSSQCCSRYSPSELKSEAPPFQKRHSFKVTKNETRSFEEPSNPKKGFATERLSRYEAEQHLKAMQQKQEQVRMRRLHIQQKRNDVLKRSAEEFEEKLKQVKTNQQELDQALDKWRDQVVCYQDAANTRAAERLNRTVEEKSLRARQGRLSKQQEHKKNLQKIQAEDFAKLQEMMAKLRSKDERCKAFAQEKNFSMEQSRQLALAASDLRDLIRQRLDHNSFLRKSHQAALESRLLNIEPRITKTRSDSEDKE